MFKNVILSKLPLFKNLIKKRSRTHLRTDLKFDQAEIFREHIFPINLRFIEKKIV